MPLKVVCFCSYLTTTNNPWRPRDFDAHDFVHALKGRQLNKYARIPIFGKDRLLENRNLSDAVDWFAELVADYFQKHKIHTPLCLVPIPSSTSSIRSSKKPETLKLANAVARAVGKGCQVNDCLRWQKAVIPASKGGPRDPETLHSNLVVTRSLSSFPHILVDDVLTSGGHLQASATVLKEKGAKVRMAVCGGRTVHVPPKVPFKVITEILDDYEP